MSVYGLNETLLPKSERTTWYRTVEQKESWNELMCKMEEIQDNDIWEALKDLA